MTRDEFILAAALMLFAAFILGWFGSWLISRVTRPGHPELENHRKLLEDLHEAESARDQAIRDSSRQEATLHERLAFTSSELASSREALNEARQEIEELRAYIERNIASPG
ncbi:hypothetical protein [Paracoccus aerodenitrificans]|uniref:hypothetical protein n=1 Tax=Paracoccus aerodenitrificans TaxID=3017781 RepID=UPI0022F05860|nr:hypothetical protein [Paracoccus aerodenitrificans]WBU62831.1 hypothetical protein PAE61_10640 [Paracoccus aerodenitrificans]